VKSLRHAAAILNGNIDLQPTRQVQFTPTQQHHQFSVVKGQSVAKRMLTIAAAGHHHALLVSPPGTGKTLLAKSVLSLMPSLTRQEIINNKNLQLCRFTAA